MPPIAWRQRGGSATDEGKWAWLLFAGNAAYLVLQNSFITCPYSTYLGLYGGGSGEHYIPLLLSPSAASMSTLPRAPLNLSNVSVSSAHFVVRNMRGRDVTSCIRAKLSGVVREETW